MDLPIGGLTGAGVGLILLRRDRWAVGAFGAGLLGPVLLHAALQSQVTGTPLPAEMYPAAFEYPGSFWASPSGRWTEPGPRWRFGLDFVIGRQGWLTVCPALWLGLVGLVGALLARRGSPRAALRPVAVIVAGTLGVLIVYYTWGVRRTDFAGASWGVRHLLVAGLRGVAWSVGWGIIGLLTLVGGIYAVEGAIDPWTRVENRMKADPVLRAVQQSPLIWRYGTFRDERGIPFGESEP